MNSSAAIYLVVGTLGFAGAIFFFWAGFQARRQASQVAESGVTCDAQVVSRRIAGGRRSATFHVTFRFDVVGPDGKTTTCTQDQIVNRENYDALPEDSKVAVRYLPSNPERTARLTGAWADNSDSNGALAYGSGCLIAAVIIIIMALSLAAQPANRASATAAKLGTASSDFAPIRTAIEPHFADWEKVDNKDEVVHHITPSELDLGPSKLETVVYGYCTPTVFYVYAARSFQPGRASNSHYSDAYGFTSKPADLCWPSGWIVAKQGDLGGGWFLATVVEFDPTSTPAPR
ncbi:MAG TPA: DUF3592 domain-containing protein [Aggregatilineales bacterium]|nr:DUF3592 domain-containing protein [Aggregatilineales bacterium]